MLPSLDEASPEATTIGAVLLLAVLQGLTEFLPISSSGHLVIGRELLNVQASGLALDVALHMGTLAAVLWAYRREVGSLITDLLGGRPRMVLWLLLATVPAGVAGLLLRPALERAATSTAVAGGGLLVTACLLIVGERARRRQGAAAQEDRGGYGVPSWGLALLLGLAQALAICPGISRAGTTIAAGLVLGLPIAQAARLSFLMSIPVVCGAGIVELPGALEAGIGDLSNGLVLGAAALAAFVGWGSLRALLLVTARGAFGWFALYCGALGLGVLAFM